MKAKNLINQITKGGFEVKNNGNQYWADGSQYTCSFYIQGENAICVNVRFKKDEHDFYSDYHAGFYTRKIKEVVQWLKKEAA